MIRLFHSVFVEPIEIYSCVFKDEERQGEVWVAIRSHFTPSYFNFKNRVV